MSCSCNNNKEIIQNEKLNLYYISDTKPFQICPLCAFKHISYALIKFEKNETNRAIANIYLAYKHLYKYFEKESKQVFNLIVLYFKNNLTLQKLQIIVTMLHNLAIQYKEINNDFIELKQPVILENSLLSKPKCIYLNLLIVNELFNYEIGYKDINTPYCIGLLQQCAEYQWSQIQQNRIRGLWKSIETDKKLSSNIILDIADDILYRQKKDNNLN